MDIHSPHTKTPNSGSFMSPKAYTTQGIGSPFTKTFPQAFPLPSKDIVHLIDQEYSQLL